MSLILVDGGDATRSAKVDGFHRSLNPGRRRELQRPLAEGMLKIIARGQKQDEAETQPPGLLL